jgi:flagellar basal body-associated protein FliL
MINDLKSKLPLGKKAKGNSDELEDIEEALHPSQVGERTDVTDISKFDLSDDEENHSKSMVHKLKEKITGIHKNAIKKQNQNSDSDADAAKKKKSKILQIAIGVGLVLFILSDYIIPPEEPAPVAVVKKRNKKVPVAETTAPATEEPKTEAAAGTETTTETPSEVTETNSDSPVTVTSQEPATTELVTEPTPEATTTETVTTTPEPTATEPVPGSTPEPTTTVEATSTTETTTTTEPIDTSHDPGNTPDSVDGTQTTGTTDENLTDQILQDLEKQVKTDKPIVKKTEYVTAPDYEYRGRGLVYNCRGKHWACIDAPSYKACEDNSSSTKYLKKTTECVPFNVYETLKGCESMQNRMVSSSAKTNFCNE